MAKRSSGLLVWRRRGGRVEVLLVHPGGPFWGKKDAGAWSAPKGEVEEGEEPSVAVALREFCEETGCARREDGSVAELRGEFVALGEVKQAGGKVVSAWAVEGDFDVARLKSNTFEMEWPMKSGRMKSFPEVDRAEWFGLDEAREKILKGQAELVERLARLLS
jgi:predicted NUDIX family NTP pyrophosphohydrolase